MVTDACLTHHPKCPIHFACVHTCTLCVYVLHVYICVCSLRLWCVGSGFPSFLLFLHNYMYMYNVCVPEAPFTHHS